MDPWETVNNLNTSSPSIHASWTKQSYFSKTNSRPQGHKYYTIIRTSNHLGKKWFFLKRILHFLNSYVITVSKCTYSFCSTLFVNTLCLYTTLFVYVIHCFYAEHWLFMQYTVCFCNTRIVYAVHCLFIKYTVCLYSTLFV